MKNENIEKFISLILRHKPETINICLDSEGWANTNELINGIKKSGTFIDNKILEEVVINSDKQRFSFNLDKTKIRANQGHSITVDIGLKETIPPEFLYHGTATKVLDDILKKGILKRSRQYVHLSKDIETAINVGSRHGNPVILRINTKEMLQDGHIFYLSENGVWLSKDIPPKYFKVISV